MIVARSYCASSFDGVARGVWDGKTAEGGFILPQIEGRRAGTTPRRISARWPSSASRWGSTRSGSSITCCTASDRRACARCLGGLVAALGAGGGHDQTGSGNAGRLHRVRSPALLAKMADTVDEISDGRLILGIGAGYFEREYNAFGFPYDHRFSRFEEALEIISGLLRDGEIDYEGKFYFARECELRPRGPRPAGPPIMIGTRGEKMLRLTAKHADSWNGWLARGDNRPAAIPPLRADVDAACTEVGRDPATLERTATVFVDPTDRAAQSSRGPVSGTRTRSPQRWRPSSTKGSPTSRSLPRSRTSGTSNRSRRYRSARQALAPDATVQPVDSAEHDESCSAGLTCRVSVHPDIRSRVCVAYVR